MVSTSFMVDTSSHPRAQLHRCVEKSAYEGREPEEELAPGPEGRLLVRPGSTARTRRFSTAATTRPASCAWNKTCWRQCHANTPAGRTAGCGHASAAYRAASALRTLSIRN